LGQKDVGIWKSEFVARRLNSFKKNTGI